MLQSNPALHCQTTSSAILPGPKFYSMLRETSEVSMAAAGGVYMKQVMGRVWHQKAGRRSRASLNDSLYLLWDSSLITKSVSVSGSWDVPTE